MPNPIIVVGNEKGGCGKTTISVHLAVAAARDGFDVLLVDGDPGQQSTARWAAMRAQMHPDAPAIKCVTVTGRDIRAQMRDLAGRYQLVILDTGAEDSQELRAAISIATVLVVPVQPESLDLWTLPTMERLFTNTQSFNPQLKAVIAINRAPYQTVDSVAGDVRGFMAANVPGLPTASMATLTGRTAYGRAISEGLSVVEMSKRDIRACNEIERLWKEVSE
jgi:chromosome partitioning protein